MSPDSLSPEPSAGAGVEALFELLVLALGVLEDEGREALEEFLAEHREQAPTLRRRLELLAGTGLDPTRTSPGGVPDELGDFRLKRQLGSGGMGVVWLAEQVSLGREVAVKLVRPDRLLFPGALERFRREVETVARLQHPGIVPVYAVGEQSGMPYFAMERVQGASLDIVLRAVRGQDPATLSGADLVAALPPETDGEVTASELYAGSWPEVCLRIVLEVAEALEHARRRGVVHRDVKPGNIMVTRGGRVLLLDFGLSSRSADSRLTRSSSAVGSLAYMAPELTLAEGEHARLPANDPRQDVYSLGVTLYELLALVPPYRGDSEVALLRAIAEGNVKSLRKLNRTVPPDAETVTAAAMERDPDRRYEDPGRLARDLGNVLALRPIEARPPGVLLRARRWAQRHPAGATVFAALVLGPSALLVQEVRARNVVEAKNSEIRAAGKHLARTNRQLEEALTTAAGQRDRAEGALDKAMEAVDRMLVHVGGETLRGMPGMERVRGDLLEEALAFQEWFLETEGETPRLRMRAIDVARRTTEVQNWLGRFDAMQATLTRMEELIGAELEDRGSEEHAELLIALSKLRVYRGKFARHADDLVGAEEQLRQALEATAALPDGDRQVCRTRANAFVELARIQVTGGAMSEARSTFEEAVRLLEDVHARTGSMNQDRDQIAYDLCFARDLLGEHLSLGAGLGQSNAAELAGRALELHEASAATGEGLVARNPRDAEYRFQLARSLNGVAVLRAERSERAAAEAAYTRSVALTEELVRDFPGHPLYLAELGNRCANLGGLLFEAGEEDRGRELIERGAEAYGKFFAENPGDVDLRLGYVACLYNLGTSQARAGEFDAAVATFDLLLEELSLASRQSPDHPAVGYLERLVFEALLSEYVLFEQPERARKLAQRFHDGAARTASWREMLGLLADAHREVLETEGVTNTERGEALANLGEFAAELLERAFASGELEPGVVERDSVLAPFLDHPSFVAVIEGLEGSEAPSD